MKFNSFIEFFQPKENNFIILAMNKFFKNTDFLGKKGLFNSSYIIKESLIY